VCKWGKWQTQLDTLLHFRKFFFVLISSQKRQLQTQQGSFTGINFLFRQNATRVSVETFILAFKFQDTSGEMLFFILHSETKQKKNQTNSKMNSRFSTNFVQVKLKKISNTAKIL
jgi:hypothetical protein